MNINYVIINIDDLIKLFHKLTFFLLLAFLKDFSFI